MGIIPKRGLQLRLVLVLTFSTLGAVQVVCETEDWDSEAILSINFGNEAPSPYELYSPAALSAGAQIYTATPNTLGTYGSHVWSEKIFTYTLDLRDKNIGNVDLKLGFAEVIQSACKRNGRLMNIAVAQYAVKRVNIFRLAGCRVKYDIKFPDISTTAPIVISVQGVKRNPMLSTIAIRPVRSAGTTPPTTTPTRAKSNPIPVSNTVQMINAGESDGITGPLTTVYKAPDMVIDGTIRPEYFQTFRYGGDFSYHFRGSGTVEVQLGFAEVHPLFCTQGSARKFSVYLNRDLVPELKDLNVFERVGCARTFFWKTTFDMRQNLHVRFISASGNAMVSFILIRKVRPLANCVPESTANGATSDHIAHAVPGDYPPVGSTSKSYSDNDNNGYEEIEISGKRSHSHFFDVESGVSGRVTQYEWVAADTGELLSEEEYFKFKFRLGTTILQLNVVDNVCSTSSAETSVTVTGSVRKGTYCYFYPGLSFVPDTNNSSDLTRPSFAQRFDDTNWNFGSVSFANLKFSVSCIFFLDVEGDTREITIGVDTKGSGTVDVLRSSDRIMEKTAIGSTKVTLAGSVSSFKVTYLRSNLQAVPQMKLLVNGIVYNRVSYDQKNTFPVIMNLRPTTLTVTGGTRCRIYCIGLREKPTAVVVGTSMVEGLTFNVNKQVIWFTSPTVPIVGPTKVSLQLKGGKRTNELDAAINLGARTDQIGFNELVMKDSRTGKNYKNGFPTSVRIGMDGKLYIGTLNAQVHKVTYDVDSLQVLYKCYSSPLKDGKFSRNGKAAQRDILGLALDPKDTVPRPYVTTQTLFWFEKKRIARSNRAAWKNGAVDRLMPGSDPTNPEVCLVYDKRIVSNLPVSDHDHGVNGLEFTQDGDLLISIGGFTNMGLPGKLFGQLWDVPLSGSVVKVKLSKGSSFNGVVTYSNDVLPWLGNVTGGDIEVVATGVRNAFTLALHSSGRLYTSDNGPNGGYGNTAVSCDEQARNIVYPKKGKATDWPGTVKHPDGPKFKPFSLKRPDKLLYIKTGGQVKYYGHPNFSRKECAWIDPFTGLDAKRQSPPQNYEPPLGMLTSSVDGIIEYHAGAVFGGRMKGRLILSTYRNHDTYSASAGTLPAQTSLNIISKNGGLSTVMDSRGTLFFPRVHAGTVLALKPKIPKLVASKDVTVIAATPFRHGKSGGTIATIGGLNFGRDPAMVKIGGRRCRLRTQSEGTITCTVPTGSGGSLPDIAVTKPSGQAGRLAAGLWYTAK